ncbi:hypothetical protein [Mucilaginibacter polytrichastri]|uniref:hypothetical protein n=1 Tax=Mucilaginibacter polytrichastri TaxID=1302689 RepID=UPI0008E1FF86|nr:hypothetical protein [Mucilaginibacter polytrichastri]SFT08460.1 hypothetical protein SAMN04487890_11033 [Mucilaginibacter polytrichastri]
MGNYSDKEKSTMRDGGYRQTSDSDVWKKDNHTITRRNETTIFNTDRHTTNGSGISDSLFSKKAK